MTQQHYACPVCDYPDLREPPYSAAGWGSFEICPQCGTEFGYDVVNAAFADGGFDAVCGLSATQAQLDALHASLRAEWVAGGRKWSTRHVPARAGGE